MSHTKYENIEHLEITYETISRSLMKHGLDNYHKLSNHRMNSRFETKLVAFQDVYIYRERTNFERNC